MGLCTGNQFGNQTPGGRRTDHSIVTMAQSREQPRKTGQAVNQGDAVG